MAILEYHLDYAGQSGQKPRYIKILTNNTLAEVTAAGFLNSLASQGNVLLPTDMALVSHDDTSGLFNLEFSDTGVITLVAVPAAHILPLDGVEGNFIVFSATPGEGQDLGYVPSNPSKTTVVMAGSSVATSYIAKFADTTGTIDDTAGTAVNAGSIQAGLSGTAGVVTSYPATVATGSLSLTAVSSSGNFAAVVSNRSLAQATTFSLGDPGQSTASILCSKVNADVGANLITFDITVGQASLATGGSVTLYASSGSKQYKIRSLWVNSGGTNFSGGGGDRLLSITDNTTVYSVVPAASLQTLANAGWGVTALPYPASAAINASTAAGASLVAKYSGGTTDYTAGSIVISGTLERVA